MIVIVIVGILSAVALPNFLSQTERAKTTEAKSKVSGLLKEAHAEYQLQGTAALAASGIGSSITRANQGGIFGYAFPASPGANDTELQIIAEANATSESSNADASIAGKLIYGCVNLTTGKIEVSSGFEDAGTSYADGGLDCGGTGTAPAVTVAL